MTRLIALVFGAGLLLFSVAVVNADKDSNWPWQTVVITLDKAAVLTCGAPIDVVKDDNMKDMKVKAAKRGGNTILITDQNQIDPVGAIYRCPPGQVIPSADASDIFTRALKEREAAIARACADPKQVRAGKVWIFDFWEECPQR